MNLPSPDIIRIIARVRIFVFFIDLIFKPNFTAQKFFQLLWMALQLISSYKKEQLASSQLEFLPITMQTWNKRDEQKNATCFYVAS